MQKEAYGQMLGVIGEAIDLAEDAVKAAEDQAKAPEPSVTLVKVANDKARSAAARLMKTGAFSGDTEETLASKIENAGPTELLELMEKLASKAVFPLNASFLAEDGELVEKSAQTRGVPEESSTELWSRCMEEAGFDVSG